MKHKITLIPGEGIGPEVAAAMVRVVEATGVDIEWDEFVAGVEAANRFGDPLPSHIVQSVKVNRVAIKGPVTTPVGGGYTSVNVRLRKELDLYASVRPIRNLPGVDTKFHDVDLIVIRENTEDLYSGLEHIVVPGVVESLKIITEKASTRIARYAFELARREGRKKVTAVHKANIMKLSDGLFLDCVHRVSREFPDIDANDKIVDNACMQLVMNPHQFDVLLLENLYGDIISDLAAGLVGGLGVTPGANIGADVAVFEAVHGTAPDIAGKNLANPTALILSAIMMLQHIDEREAAERVRRALDSVLARGDVRTRDLGGHATTTDYANAIIKEL
jgi:isocitrate dehydrogenase (NAD+)